VSISSRFTSKDLEKLPAIDGLRYEIVDGDLFVSKQPHWHHQYTADRVARPLHDWNDRTGLARIIHEAISLGRPPGPDASGWFGRPFESLRARFRRIISGSLHAGE